MKRGAARPGSGVRAAIARGLVKLTVMLLSLALPLAAAEAILRTLPQPDSWVLRDGRRKPRFNTYVSSGTLSYELRPNWVSVHDSGEFEVTVRTNALGLRGPLASEKPRPGTHRILVLGDSFTFGFGVEDDETYPARLEAWLRERSLPVEVLNAGVPGWATDQYYLFLETRLDEIEPDLVVLGLYENDPGDLAWHSLVLDDDRLPVRIQSMRHAIDHRGAMRFLERGRLSPPAIDFPGKGWLQDHSQLYHWARYRLLRAWLAMAEWTTDSGPEPGVGDVPGPIPSLAPEEVNRGLATSSAFRLRYHAYLMEAIERLCQERGVSLRVALLTGPDAGGVAVETLRAACASRPDLCLDTVEGMPADGRERLYFPVDGHWNAAGHQWAAEVVGRWLASDAALWSEGTTASVSANR